MPAKKTYQLTLKFPDGKVTVYRHAFPTRRRAAQAAYYALVDNHAANSNIDAAEFASKLQDAPLGTALEHPSGYTFTIEAR